MNLSNGALGSHAVCVDSMLHCHVLHCHVLLMVAGKWTVQQAAEMSVAAPTIEASLDGRFISGLKGERVKAAKFYEQFGVNAPSQLVRMASQCFQ